MAFANIATPRTENPLRVSSSSSGRRRNSNTSITVMCRGVTSFVWFPMERMKLLVQNTTLMSSNSASAADRSKKLIQVWSRSLYLGCFASLSQRTLSSGLMLYGQHVMSPLTEDATSYKVVNQGMAGFFSGVIGGALQAPFEHYKIRRSIVKVPAMSLTGLQGVRVAILPMMLRHGVFDGTFFATKEAASLADPTLSQASLFALSAVTASATNILFDVWKTRACAAFPSNVSLFSLVQEVGKSPTTYCTQLAVKGMELSGNWFLTGLCVSMVLGLTLNTETEESTTR